MTPSSDADSDVSQRLFVEITLLHSVTKQCVYHISHQQKHVTSDEVISLDCLPLLCGCVGVWVCGCAGVWVCGCVAVRVCGCVGVWVCGCVTVWVCGCVGVWVCGCVGVWVALSQNAML